MDKKFRDFITERFVIKNESLILDALKNKPDELKALIRSKLDDWSRNYVIRSRNSLYFRYEEDSDELMEYWRELFRDELA